MTVNKGFIQEIKIRRSKAAIITNQVSSIIEKWQGPMKTVSTVVKILIGAAFVIELSFKQAAFVAF